MSKILKKVGFIIGLGVVHSVYAADIKTTGNEDKANQYTKCASSALTTGFIKTAFNQQSDRESQALIYGGAGMALYAGYLTSPEYALSSYKVHQQKIKQDSLKYISNGSRNEIYKFTVSYLVPKNEKCEPLFRELGGILAKKDADWDSFQNSDQAKELMKNITQSAKQMIVGKNSN
ncbi:MULTISPECIES: hypothetical protein [unclassified Acinetobacter]|uniref:hypothetical protein n=1 Tax=unclassified Acinetobacter TaxID=196816 RepID=UPI002447F86A|nr:MULTISPECIES: hypothetical protein [unclassified Acinetobacter]MDH0032561.1 hypothetical protein [Acinetobacter sp. GD04021]MDH0885252.1 hypothetical protein [Acinetobacter sp. GD03873]MDH1084420.1 hypothetical protein [Acinetobacter sp. GD03983]MDH2188308.1 hypothetical protein [Acinetobacter sp. GD03645]MDH2203819.1 hypothetical protein [Acinetobacter sp. GD03647]